VKARSVKCPACGKQHVPGFAFCQRCGAALDMPADREALHSASARPATVPIDAEDESDFGELSPAAAREMAANRRAGCAGIFAIVLLATALAIVLRTGS
jgi:hypothetical protein